MGAHPGESDGPAGIVGTPVVAAEQGAPTFGTGPGITLERRWTRPGVHPYDEIEWETRTASIANESGKTVFEQTDVEVPASWSQLATNVVVSKYFRGHIGAPDREHSVRQLIDRVVDTIAGWGEKGRYFATAGDLETFRAELRHLLVHQKMAFNSPVWFNVGIEERPQCSACFINSVEDSMTSIMDLAKTEAMLFKYGSGAGTNLSPIRSSRERMSGGGMASGPVSFMKGYDAFAGVDQVRRQDPPRGEDGHPRRRSPGHRRLHRLQAERGEEGLGPHRGGLRRLVHRRGLRLGLLPERQPLGARHRRVHARRRAGRRLDDPPGDHR